MRDRQQCLLGMLQLLSCFLAVRTKSLLATRSVASDMVLDEDLLVAEGAGGVFHIEVLDPSLLLQCQAIETLCTKERG